MGKALKIRPKQIRTARKLISSLPEKDDGCSREEAAALLEKDFKKAFKKGYTPKEICALFKQQGIIIAKHLVEKYQIDEDSDQENININPDKSEENIQINNEAKISETQNQEEKNSNTLPEQKPKTFLEFDNVHKKQSNESQKSSTGYSSFKIIPDTPIGEL